MSACALCTATQSWRQSCSPLGAGPLTCMLRARQLGCCKMLSSLPRSCGYLKSSWPVRHSGRWCLSFPSLFCPLSQIPITQVDWGPFW
ncbi:hypothetical protein BC828DRAFT_416946 [Blastocladiella britannica]|nr:hypothetical protein BC828DRAFT_416946 [Blastocladiella britannica]